MRKLGSLNKGFTLVELLIVVIILGILAAIVIPQFTSASEDAKKSSLTSQLQTLRSQVELYKLQHGDKYPTSTGAANGAWSWAKLTGKTTEDGSAGGTFGPYVQNTLINPLNGSSDVGYAAADPTFGGAWTGAATDGWLITANGKFFASSKGAGYVFDEPNPANVNNSDAASEDP